MAGDLLSRLHVLKSVSNPEPPQLTDLPASLVSRFVGQNGKYLLKIYGRGDIWNMDALRQFVHDVRTVDPRATGNPLQAYECSLEMKHSYELATIYSLIVISCVLWFDFKNIKHCLMAAVPQFMGIASNVGPVGLSERAAESGEPDCRADDFGHRRRLRRVHRARISGAEGALPNVARHRHRRDGRFADHADRLRQPADRHAPRACKAWGAC